jgi:hypothetical protein
MVFNVTFNYISVSVVTQSDFRIKMAALALIGREIYYFLSRTNTCKVPDLPEIFCRG